MELKSLLSKSTGVLYCSSRGHSGYAESGKMVLHHLMESGIPISWNQLNSSNINHDESDELYKSLRRIVNKNIEFDTAIFHCTPDIWFEFIEKYKIKFINKKLIGYTTWETNKLPELWVNYINLLDEVWVPSEFNKIVFQSCGVSIPIFVVPYPSLEQKLEDINVDSLSSFLKKCKFYNSKSRMFKYGEKCKIFYTIGEWSDRKNIDATVDLFCKTFSSNDNVKLIIKTFHLDYTKKNENYCIDKLERILENYKDHPEILLITDDLSQKELLFIHSIGHCFLSMSRGEGFCINAFEAFNFKRDVIIPKFGGHVDYLGDNYAGLVGYNLVDVNFVERNSIYFCDQKWADPDLLDAGKKLCNIQQKISGEVKNEDVEFSSGWHFKETFNGENFRYSSLGGLITIKNQDIDLISFKLKGIGPQNTSEVSFIIDKSRKKTFTVSNEKFKIISIPCKYVKNIEIILDGKPQTENCILDNFGTRSCGIVLTNISLNIKDKFKILGINNIECNNEVVDFFEFPKLNKISDKIQPIVKNEIIRDCKLNLIDLDISKRVDFSGIVYYGQYGTSGYATATKGNLCHFFKRGIPISWIPLYFDNSKMSDECYYNAMVKSLIKKPIQGFDTVFFHTTPDIWPEMLKHNKSTIGNNKVIGYTVWETSKLPESWVNNINSCVEEVWCPSTYNEKVFKLSGVTIPIKVFPHEFLQKDLPNKNSVELIYNRKFKDFDDIGYYTFYNISELNPRKGVEDLVKSFCEAFNGDDRVRLILKIHYRNYDDVNKIHCVNKINDIIKAYSNPPLIHLLCNNLTEYELLALHSIGDCYVSLCKSEGFGLTIFEAYKYGKDIITTGYGGHVDFLGTNHKGLVNFKMGNLVGMKDFSKHYTDDQEWAYPDLEHAKELMKSIVKT